MIIGSIITLIFKISRDQNKNCSIVSHFCRYSIPAFRSAAVRRCQSIIAMGAIVDNTGWWMPLIMMSLIMIR